MLDINIVPFPILETERLTLRCVDLNDAVEMFEMRSNADVMKYIPVALAQQQDQAVTYIESLAKRMEDKECINWAITEKGSSKMIGTIGFYRMKLNHYRTEVGYMLHPSYQGKGYVPEAVRCLIEYGFKQLGFHSLEAIIQVENVASMRVLEKCGFVKEAHFTENEYFNGRFIDTAVYSLINR
ncbi:GNAT family N-acetyltransferase [Myroides albus]|uniref:GNAT family N-acetyltransferase n=1 Tax=Myroides albus TaxID=2562892 RepID=UPI002159720F|nr:GNAT family N-acetyltransferase [Myroides albus]UVD79356.1 GNAT family N-acetyltransferase [Myroides albus]